MSLNTIIIPRIEKLGIKQIERYCFRAENVIE